jgi:hypothetical protein
MKPMRRPNADMLAVALTAAILRGCGPRVTADDRPDSTGPTSSTGSGSNESTEASAESSGSSIGSSTPGSSEESSTSSTGGEACQPETDEALCSVRCQDCPSGHKCTPFNGGVGLVEPSCVSLDIPAGSVGAECAVEDDGRDSCEATATCWDANAGGPLCRQICFPGFDAGAGECELADERCVGIGQLPAEYGVCAPPCDPFGGTSCNAGAACRPHHSTCDSSGDTSCFPFDSFGTTACAWISLDPDGPALGDPCTATFECTGPMDFCVPAALVPECAGPVGCCSSICNASSGDGDSVCAGLWASATCRPLFEVGARPSQGDAIGFCSVP